MIGHQLPATSDGMFLTESVMSKSVAINLMESCKFGNIFEGKIYEGLYHH